MASALSDLTSTLISALSNLPPPEKIQDADRMQLLGVIGQLQSALEPPQLPIQRFCFSVWLLQSQFTYLFLSLKRSLILSWVALWHRRHPDSSGHGDL